MQPRRQSVTLPSHTEVERPGDAIPVRGQEVAVEMCAARGASSPRLPRDPLSAQEQDILNRCASATPEMMSERALLRRTDTRFLFAARAVTVVALVCALVSPVHGGGGDLTARLEIGSRYHLVPDLQLSVSGQFRMDRMLSTTESLMPEVELRYRLFKELRFAGGYRFVYRRNGDGEFENAHRVYFDAKVGSLIGGVDVCARMRLQDNFEWTKKGRRKDKPSLRTAIGAAYRAWDAARPFLAGEHFLALDSPEGVSTRKWRVTMGVELPLSPLEWEAYYSLDIPDEGDDYKHIVGLTMYVDIDSLLTPKTFSSQLARQD